MARLGRGALGFLFLCGGGFCALFAYEEGGGRGGDFDWSEMVDKGSGIIALGAPMFGLTGVLLARTGGAQVWPLGTGLAIAAILVAAYSATFDGYDKPVADFASCIGVALVLALAAVIALGRKDA